MKVSVTKYFSFEACHHLPNYNGACSRMHGHSYKLHVTISSDVDEVSGMVCDFNVIKDLVKKLIVDKYDHEDLNKFFKLPTAENMCVDFYKVLSVPFSRMGLVLESVKLWETDSSYAECSWR